MFSFCCFVFAKKHPRKCCFGWQLLHLAFKWDWVNISSAWNSEWGNYWAFSCELEGWLRGDRWWMAKQLQCFLFFVIKQLVHTSAVHSLGYKALGKFREQSRSYSCSWLHLEQLLCIFLALQTSCVLHISINTHWHMNQLSFKWMSWHMFCFSWWVDWRNCRETWSCCHITSGIQPGIFHLWVRCPDKIHCKFISTLSISVI